MRIDAMLLPQIPGLAPAPAQPGHTLPFGAFLSLPHSGDAEDGTQPKAAPVLSQYVFGFDAVGMLGIGGPAGVGKPLGTVPDAVSTIGLDRTGQQGLHPSAEAARTPISHMPAVPAYASVPYTAFQPSHRLEAPGAAPVVTDPAAKPARLTLPGVAQAAGAVPWTSAALSRPVAAGQVPVVTAPSAVAADRPSVAGIRVFDGDTAKDVEAPRRAQAAFRFEPDAEAIAGQVSVTVSDGEDLLNVVAAAPGLSENDRQVLRVVADEAAAEAGITLGELRLNGVVVRQLSKTT